MDLSLGRLRSVVLGAALGAIALLCVRALSGGFRAGPLSIHSPLPLEEFLGAGFLILVLLAGRDGTARPEQRYAGLRILPFLTVLLVVGFMFSWNLRDPFLSDDYILIGRTSLDANVVSWSFKNAGGDGAFRPIGYVYRALVGQWAGMSPWRWHLSGLILHLTNCSLLYYLCWVLWSSEFISVSAALLFGLHGTRPEVVTWSAGNYDSLACCFSLAALIIAFRARKSQRVVTPLVLLAGILVLAIWSKESAYVMPVVLLGFAWATGDLRSRPIWRCEAVAIAVCAALFWYRWVLFRGPGGYVDPGTGRPAILTLSLVGSVKALLLRLWAILLFPLNYESGDRLGLSLATAACGVLLIVLALGARRQSRRLYIAMLAMTAFAVIPAIHLALIGPSGLGSRILYFPSVGFSILCAHLLATVDWRVKPVMPIVVLALSTSLTLAHNLRSWHRTAVLADKICATVAASNVNPKLLMPPRAVHGVYFFANGLPECVFMKRLPADQR